MLLGALEAHGFDAVTTDRYTGDAFELVTGYRMGKDLVRAGQAGKAAELLTDLCMPV